MTTRPASPPSPATGEGSCPRMSVPSGRVLVTCLDGLDHLVPEPVLATATDGRYTAACGRIVLPAALLVPGGRRCPLCWTAAAHPEPERRRRRHREARRLRSIHRRARARRGRLSARLKGLRTRE
jgi:hypothetical protein